MTLTNLSTNSISKIFKILEPRNFKRIDALRRTNSKFNRIAIFEKKPLKIDDVTLYVVCDTFERRDSNEYRFQALARGNTYTALFSHRRNIVNIWNPASRLGTLFKKSIKRIRSIKRLSLCGWTITDKNVQQLQLLKSEMKIVKSVKFYNCRLLMTRESFNLLLNLMNLEGINLSETECVFKFDNSVFWNMKSVYYEGFNMFLLNDELIEHWLENPPRNFVLKHPKTYFTIPAIIKLIEMLLMKAHTNKHPKHCREVKLGQIEATDGDLRALTNYIQHTRNLSWRKLHNTYFADTKELALSFEAKTRSQRRKWSLPAM